MPVRKYISVIQAEHIVFRINAGERLITNYCGSHSTCVRPSYLQVSIMRIDIGVSFAHPVLRVLLCRCSFCSPCIWYMILDGLTICHASVFHAYTALQGHVLRGKFLTLLAAILLVIPFSNERMGGRMHREWEVVKQMETPVRFVQRIRMSLKWDTPLMRDMSLKIQHQHHGDKESVKGRDVVEVVWCPVEEDGMGTQRGR